MYVCIFSSFPSGLSYNDDGGTSIINELSTMGPQDPQRDLIIVSYVFKMKKVFIHTLILYIFDEYNKCVRFDNVQH